MAGTVTEKRAVKLDPLSNSFLLPVLDVWACWSPASDAMVSVPVPGIEYCPAKYIHPGTDTLLSSPATQAGLPVTRAGPLAVIGPGRAATVAAPNVGWKLARSPSIRMKSLTAEASPLH
jgi:hypothetical protein